MLIMIYLISFFGIIFMLLKFGAVLIQIALHLINIVVAFGLLVIDLASRFIVWLIEIVTFGFIKITETTISASEINAPDFEDVQRNREIQSRIARRENISFREELDALKARYFLADARLFQKYFDNKHDSTKLATIKTEIINSHYFNLNN